MSMIFKDTMEQTIVLKIVQFIT